MYVQDEDFIVVIDGGEEVLDAFFCSGVRMLGWAIAAIVQNEQERDFSKRHNTSTRWRCLLPHQRVCALQNLTTVYPRLHLRYTDLHIRPTLLDLKSYRAEMFFTVLWVTELTFSNYVIVWVLSEIKSYNIVIKGNILHLTIMYSPSWMYIKLFWRLSLESEMLYTLGWIGRNLFSLRIKQNADNIWYTISASKIGVRRKLFRIILLCLNNMKQQIEKTEKAYISQLS